MTPQNTKLHLVRLAERAGLSPFTFAFCVFAVFGFFGWIPILWISYANNIAVSTLIVPTVTMLINVLALSYILGMTVFSVRRLKQHLDLLKPHFRDDQDAFTSLLQAPELCRHPKTHFWVTCGGLAFGLTLVTIGRIYVNVYSEGLPPGYEGWPFLIIPCLWASIAYAAWIFVDNARYIGNTARHLPHVDLFDTSAMTAFSRVTTSQILFVLGAMAVLPLQAIIIGDIEVDDFTPPGIVAMLLIGYSIMHPLADVRARLREAKQSEIEKVTAKLRAIPTEHRMTHEDVPKLLSYRAAIEAVDEWPLSSSTLLRLGFYIFIPPVTWALAAVISFYVESFFSTL